MTIADIWTKFYIELKHHTINMMECSKFTWLEDPRWWRPQSWISENVNNFGLDKDILDQIIWEDVPWRRGDDHVTKSRNRKFFLHDVIIMMNKGVYIKRMSET